METRKTNTKRNKVKRSLEIKILYLNARGIKSKIESLHSILEEIKPDILGITETHLTGRATISINGYNQAVVRNRNKKGGGLLLAVKENTNIKLVVTHISEEHEQLWAHIQTPNEDYRIALVYGLHEGRPEEKEKIEDWYYSLEEEYSKCYEHPVIMMGDYNAHIGADNQGIEDNNIEINMNGYHLRNFIDRRELTLVNKMDICKGKWTRKDPNGGKSILDFVVVNSNMVEDVKSMKIDEDEEVKITRYRKINGKGEEFPSDHNSIILNIKGNKGEYKKKKQIIWNFKQKEGLEKFNNETAIVIMKERWEEGGQADEKYKRWQNQVQGLMYKCFQRISVKHGKKSGTVRKMIKNKRKIKNEISKLNTIGIKDGIINRYMKNKLDKQIEEIINEIQREKTQKVKMRLEQMLERGESQSNEIWNLRKRAMAGKEPKIAILDSNGNMLINENLIQNRYNEYYKNLLKPREPKESNKKFSEEIHKIFEINMKIRQYDEDEINQKFSMKELKDIIERLESKKCPGPDGIGNEIFKAMGKNLIENILNMLNYFWMNEKLPRKLLELDVKSMYKGKGKRSDLGNQRGVFMANTVMKIYEKMIYSRINKIIENKGFTEAQAGGRKGRSTCDQLFILRTIMNHYKYKNKELYIEFLDLVKAFDKMILKGVLIDLWKIEVRGRCWRNIYHINKKTDITIKTPFGRTEKMEIGETLKQGSVLASTLAALHTDTVNRLFNNAGTGIWYGNEKINLLLFQDDIVKLEDKLEKLNEANILFTEFQNNNRMLFHEEKSIYMTTKGTNEKIILNNKELQRKVQYKYLGDIVTYDNSYDPMIKHRSNEITGITAELNSINCIINPNETSIETTITYIKGIIIPKLTTNAETWNNISMKNIEDMEKIQNKTIKRLLKLPQSTPSIGLRSEISIMSMKNIIRKKKLLYLQRTLKQSTKNITRKILMEQTKMPEKTWVEEIQQMLNELGIYENYKEIEELSKYKWKKIINKKLWEQENKELNEWIKTSTKCKKIKNPSMNRKPYIEKLKPEEAMTILTARLGMTRVKSNYKNMYNNTICDLCKTENEDLEHLLTCKQNINTSNEEEIKETLEQIWEDGVGMNTLSKLAETISNKLKGKVHNSEMCVRPVIL